MNPVISYNDFLKFMQWSPNQNNRLIPVLLIKPSTVLYLNREHMLDHLFDYYDRRSANDIQFFLPGYVHYPTTSFAEILPNWSPHNENTVAFKLSRLNNIYYSNDKFIDFVEVLERNIQDFKYYGDTVLFFIEYQADTNGKIGRLNFKKNYQFNLSELYYSNNHPIRRIDLFLESVIHSIRESRNDEELIERIKNCFGF